MMIDVVMLGCGRVTWRTTRFLPIKLFCKSFCISTCLDYDYLEHYGANAQNTYRRIHKSYCSRPIHAKRCYWAVIWNGLSRQRLKALNALYAKYANVLVEKRTLVVKSKIWNLKPNCIYSMQSIEQHYYRETEEQNSNGCKLLVKKDAMLDSLDARERSYDNSANGINFTIRKVNLIFVFIVVVWIFFFNKNMIQNPVFFCFLRIMLLC